ncbi:tRNA (adenosine(37)-N6)-dimethylallyltransferase MiaA [Pedobacter frigidisoli]|uniref:tRNA (adenosine(37)-N6)-dimethylallyltransferase MiaA n=1 Tax=Pedobacter frigidisoli TaxID=2530455 RepID=UPI00292FC405|nr:tRNA (adenosine(37)-N6)-dimethylallyltransferase MiaA [Pedobacter frigidisoli]
MENTNLIIILGATASGKTRLAVQVAHALNSEIISADSRQVFRKMDIGTGKDLSEYLLGSRNIPYHLINILDAGERYHVDAFKNDFYQAFESITAKGKIPVLCGGTGMYIHSLLQNQAFTAVPVNEALRKELDLLSKETLQTMISKSQHLPLVDLSSKKRLIRAIEIETFLQSNTLEAVERPELRPMVFGLKSEVNLTRSKILKRLDDRFDQGMIAEVEALLAEGITTDMLVFYGLEYKFIAQYLGGLLDFDELRNKLGIAICQYAKRQNTFFRKMERDGVTINWLNAGAETNLLKQLILQKV